MELTLTKNIIFKMLIAFVSLLLFDLVWFYFTTKSLYTPAIQNVSNKTDTKFRLGGGVIAWTIMAFALSVQNPTSIQDALLYGAFIGLIIYGVFNGTNYAIFDGWSSKISLVDTTWGIVNCMIASAVLYLLFPTSIS